MKGQASRSGANGIDSLFAVALLTACSTGPLYSGITHRNTCEPACPSGARCSAGHCYTEPCSSANPCRSPLSCVVGFCSDQSCDPLCAPDQVCLAQVCVAPTPSPCEPDGGCAAPQHCTVGLCVDDTCSPSCGAGQVCLSGLCVPTSGGLTCASPYVSCTSGNGDPYCADLLRDASNCGACGKQCPSGELCNGAGLCAVSCVASEANCNGRCFDLGTDDRNCGACATDCGAGQVCSGGTCAASCAVPDVACGVGTASYCADTQLDPANCGSCGQACYFGQDCMQGACLTGCGSNLAVCGETCTDLEFDDANCGACGAACGPSERCVRHECDACGEPGELCCTAAICTEGLSCDGWMCAATAVDAGLCTEPPEDGGITVTTLAGNGIAGFADGTGGLCGTAELSTPYGVAIDSAGTLYVGDNGNFRIRKIDPTGNVSTLAGNGTIGTTDGTGGPSGQASFGFPAGVAVDPAGNVYVADSVNNSIRKIDSSGNVTTLAGNGDAGYVDGTGGPTGTAEFWFPTGVAADSAGNIYVADGDNQRIRKIDPAGNVTTLAGNGTSGIVDGTVGPSGTAEFEYPDGVAVDSAGNVYVADGSNNPGDTVRKIVPDGGVTTLAASFDGATGIALDSAGNIIVADTGGMRVCQIDRAGNVTTLAGSGSGSGDGSGGPTGTAKFTLPRGVAVDTAGNIYVSDYGNNSIRVIHL